MTRGYLADSEAELLERVVRLQERQLLQIESRALALSWGHYGPSDEGISSVRPHDAAITRGPARHARPPHGPVPRASSQESEQTGAEANNQAVRFLFPRRELIPLRRADERLIGQALADDAADRRAESVGVVHVFPVVIAEGLLVEIPEQVERLDADVRSVEPALEATPRSSPVRWCGFVRPRTRPRDR